MSTNVRDRLPQLPEGYTWNLYIGLDSASHVYFSLTILKTRRWFSDEKILNRRGSCNTYDTKELIDNWILSVADGAADILYKYLELRDELPVDTTPKN